ncbi:MAG: cell filamentation protein Fic, partial [Spirochaetales bacterium]|nr:cell filamentation protein Fic [Spirochaetota bacterium]NLL24896.1 cell filamentation protein Fic [Spirochaetales bacterium]
MDGKKNHEISIRSSAAEYLTYIAAIGDGEHALEIRYEDE